MNEQDQIMQEHKYILKPEPVDSEQVFDTGDIADAREFLGEKSIVDHIELVIDEKRITFTAAIIMEMGLIKMTGSTEKEKLRRDPIGLLAEMFEECTYRLFTPGSIGNNDIMTLKMGAALRITTMVKDKLNEIAFWPVPVSLNMRVMRRKKDEHQKSGFAYGLDFMWRSNSDHFEEERQRHLLH